MVGSIGYDGNKSSHGLPLLLVGLPSFLLIVLGRESDRQDEEMKCIFIIIIKYCRAFQNNPRQTHHRPFFTFLCAFGGFDTRDGNVLSKPCGLHLKVLSTES